MNFFGFVIVVLITFVITQLAATQIIGVILFKLPKKEFRFLIGLFVWLFVLIGLYFGIKTFFENYFNVYIWISIIALIVSLLNIKNLKQESEQ